MIKVFIHNNGYNIEHNGEMIVKCVEQFVPFKELLINLGFDLNVEKVEIHEGDTITDKLSDNTEETDDIDSVIESINANFSAPNLGKYRESFESQTNTQSSFKDNTQSKKNYTKQNNVPVGSVECPNEGDLIYVDGIVGVLSTVTGGVGTVMTVYKSDNPITIYTENESFNDDEDDDYYFNDEDEDDTQNIVENNILVELEEVPGHYFSWSLLRSKQVDLQNKYGYKPVCKL